MKKQFLEIGKIVNTHGVRGDVKVQPWCDSPDFLAEFDTLYRKDRTPVTILSAKVHKGCVLMHLEGVDTMEQAQQLRGNMIALVGVMAQLGIVQGQHRHLRGGKEAVDQDQNQLKQ